jgi:hypothetical protein
LSGSILFSCCGLYSLKGGSIGEAKTLTVDFFQNRASQVNPNLSQSFTEKLKDKFLRETKLQMANVDGDFYFSGSITGYTVTPANVTGNNTASSNRLTITVQVKFVNKKEPKNSYEQSFSNFTDFDASQSFPSVESSLVDDITTKLVQDIFNRAVINW